MENEIKNNKAESIKMCKNCKHFKQHYIKIGKRFDKIVYGHCVYPRLKKSETLDKACEDFICK